MKLYRLINLLSLDVAMGAIISSLFLAKGYGVVPTAAPLISLGLTVWIIYTVDRLMDVRDAKGLVVSARHRFHQQHDKLLWWCLGAVVIINLGITFFMPMVIIKRGLLLAVVVAVYIQFRRRLYFLKEFFVALLYTAGVAVPAFPILPVEIRLHSPLLALFIIALINLIMFSWYEIEIDRSQRQASIATIWNEYAVRGILQILFLIALIIPIYLILTLQAYFVSVTLLFMTGMLMLIYFNRSFFERHEYFRLAGDIVFLFPIGYVLL